MRTVDTTVEARNRYSLTNEDVTELGRYAVIIEEHYGRPMDIEWVKDGTDGKLYILQARPETVKSQQQGKAEQRYKLKGTGTVLAEGRAIGQRSAPALCASCTTSPTWTPSSPVMCSSPT